MWKKDRVRNWRLFIFIIVCFCLLGGGLQSVHENQLSAQEKTELSDPVLQPLQPNDFPVNLDSKGLKIPEVLPQLNNYALNGDKLTSTQILVNPVVFIEFADDTGEWLSQEDFEKIDEIYNMGMNSLQQYFFEISFGNLLVQTEYFPRVTTTEGSITDQPTTYRSKYKKGYVQPKSASNPDGFDPNETNLESPNSMRYHELMVIKDVMALDNPTNVIGQLSAVSDAMGWNLNINYTSQGFDWTFPQATQIKDLEKYSVDSFTFVMRGVGKSGGNDEDILWPHRYSYPNSNKDPFGMVFGYLHVDSQNSIDKYSFINNYVVVPADPKDTSSGMNILNDDTGLGVVVHEFFHQFYAPDLYRSSYKGQAVGIWDLMGAQQDMPQYPLLYTNAKFGIWNIPDFDEVNATQSQASRSDLTIKKVTYPEIEDHFAYKIVPKNYASTKEYFMVEYREKASSGFDSMIGNTGLLIYRIHDGIPSVNKDGAFCGISCGNILTGLPGESTADEVFVFRPNAANATLFDQSAYDTENLMNATLPRTVNGKKITSLGKSLSEAPVGTFDNETLYFSDGTNSGIQIVNITDPADGEMKFTVLYDGESLPQDDALGDLLAQSSTTTLRESEPIADNTLRIQGGKAPYVVQIEEIKKDDTLQASTLFQIVDSDSSDQTAILKKANDSALTKGSYQVKVKVTDANQAVKNTTITYQVKKAYPTALNTVVYTPQAVYTTSQISEGTVLGGLGLTGCSENGCSTDYECDSIQYSLAFEAGKDYSEYFSILPLFAQSGTIRANKNIPAGSYVFHGIVTFKESGKEDVILKNETFQIVVNEDTSVSSIPTISNIQGDILIGDWKNNKQTISFHVADTNLGLKQVQVTTLDGMLVNDANENVKSIVKTYATSDAQKADDLQISVIANGTYTITVSNQEGKENDTPATFSVTKIDQLLPTLDTFTITFEENLNRATFQILASDPKDALQISSGIKQIYYQVVEKDKQVDEQAWLPYPDSNTDNWTDIRDASFCVIVEDNALNRSDPRCKSLQEDDQVEPSIGTIQNLIDVSSNPSGWTNASKITLSTQIRDDESGLASIKIMKENQELTHKNYAETMKSDTFSFDVMENGNYQVVVEDNNANVKVQAFSVQQFDREKPIIDSLTASNVTLFFLFPTNDLDVVVNAHDMPQAQNSSFVKYRYILIDKDASDPGMDDASWSERAFDESFKITKSYQGKVYIYAYDQAGNRSERYVEDITPTQTESDASLTSLSLQGGTLDQSFLSTRYSYTAKVPFTTTNVQINCEAKDENASISGDYNKPLPLSLGDNTFEILVENGGVSNTYQIMITRLEAEVLPKDATLKSLSLQNATLEEAFASNRFTYTAKVENTVTEIKIQGETTDDEAIITGDIDKTLPLQIGENIFQLQVQNEEAIATYTIKVTRLPASMERKDATLKSLKVDDVALSPSFQSDVYAYTATLTKEMMSVTIQAVATDAAAIVSGDANKMVDLKEGENIFHITVNNQGEQKIYTINLHKPTTPPSKSKDATLKSLSLRETSFTPSFDRFTYAYQAEVEHSVTSVTVNATSNDAKATLSKDANKTIALDVGVNEIKVMVQAEDASQQLYTIHVTRKATDQGDNNSSKDPETPTTSQKELISQDKQITIIGDFDEELKVISKRMETKEITLSQSASNTYQLQDIFDIHLEKADGTRYELTSTVKVRLALRDELKGKKDLIVVYMDSNGNAENMPTTVYDEYVEFSTNHFSMYAIAQRKGEVLNNQVSTGDMTMSESILMLIIVSAFGCVLLIRKKAV